MYYDTSIKLGDGDNIVLLQHVYIHAYITSVGGNVLRNIITFRVT